MSARIISDNGKVICGDCGDWLIARSQPDGRIHTWHREEPCGAEGDPFERATKALRRIEERKRTLSAVRASTPAIVEAIYRARPIVNKTPIDPYRPRG